MQPYFDPTRKTSKKMEDDLKKIKKNKGDLKKTNEDNLKKMKK
jgi:hypothetical protein